MEKNQYGRTWNKTDTVVTSIGQGFYTSITTSTAVMISRIANDGIEIFPTLIKQDKNFENNNYLDDINEEGIN